MLKLKKLYVELADDYSDREPESKKEWPYYKRWRIWCNGVCLGDIIKLKNHKTKDVNYRFYLYKCDTGDQFCYALMPDGKMVFNRDGIDPRKREGYKTFQEAYDAFKERMLENIAFLISQE